MNRSLKVDLTDIQFSGVLRNRGYDQSFYTRYIITAKIIDEIRKSIPSKRSLKILDLGGYNGAARELLAKDKVTILDIFEDNKLDDYIRVDSVGIPRPDDSFDIVISTDVLEHISRDSRDKFINEALRVAKYGVVILAPFDYGDDEVTKEELYAGSIYQGETGGEYIWLKEHREYGLPKQSWIEELLDKKGIVYAKASHTSLRLWGNLIANGFFFADNLYQVDKRSGNALRKLNETYFNNIAAVDFPKLGYRTIYVMSKYFNSMELHTPKYQQDVINHFVVESNVRMGKIFANMSAELYARSDRLKNAEQALANSSNRVNQLEDERGRLVNSKAFKLASKLQKIKHKVVG